MNTLSDRIADLPTDPEIDFDVEDEVLTTHIKSLKSNSSLKRTFVLAIMIAIMSHPSIDSILSKAIENTSLRVMLKVLIVMGVYYRMK